MKIEKEKFIAYDTDKTNYVSPTKLTPESKQGKYWTQQTPMSKESKSPRMSNVSENKSPNAAWIDQ